MIYKIEKLVTCSEDVLEIHLMDEHGFPDGVFWTVNKPGLAGFLNPGDELEYVVKEMTCKGGVDFVHTMIWVDGRCRLELPMIDKMFPVRIGL